MVIVIILIKEKNKRHLTSTLCPYGHSYARGENWKFGENVFFQPQVCAHLLAEVEQDVWKRCWTCPVFQRVLWQVYYGSGCELTMGALILESNSSGNLTPAVSETGTVFPGYLVVILSVLMVTLVIVVVAGNALVIMAFVVDKTLRTQSNYFFLNLAISDFLVGAFCIPLYIPYNLTGRWMLGKGLCKVWLVMDYLLCTASVFNIVLISYDRFLSVTRAVKYRAQRNMTRQAVLKMLAVWVLAFLLYGPAIIFWETIVGQSVVPAHECYAEFYFTWYFLLSASIFEFFTPFVSVAFFNFSIYLNIHQRNACMEEDAKPQRKTKKHKDGGGWSVFFVKTRKVTCSEPAAVSAVIEDDNVLSPSSSVYPDTSQIFVQREKFSPNRNDSRLFQHTASCMAPGRRTPGSRLSRDKKIAKSLAIIVCIFGICWAPYTLLIIIRAACSGECVANYWYEITFWLLWLNSAINPFLYPLCHNSFRRAFSKILCPKRQSVQPQFEAQSC
ncbi:histamine H3 receptor-like [Melanotaenia boesemani]|uniref:histamine H3 receptor-like n=1 Tax=Melanotaenia boesemani TaxID=1250792 RepID=UPI001C04AC03|nr:histamine H3 receptor-like [Melanotaenia boesemani]